MQRIHRHIPSAFVSVRDSRDLTDCFYHAGYIFPHKIYIISNSKFCVKKRVQCPPRYARASSYPSKPMCLAVKLEWLTHLHVRFSFLWYHAWWFWFFTLHHTRAWNSNPNQSRFVAFPLLFIVAWSGRVVWLRRRKSRDQSRMAAQKRLFVSSSSGTTHFCVFSAKKRRKTYGGKGVRYLAKSA